jgi:hypothetical protein
VQHASGFEMLQYDKGLISSVDLGLTICSTHLRSARFGYNRDTHAQCLFGNASGAEHRGIVHVDTKLLLFAAIMNN